MGLVECVPNFSEGRRREVLDAIADAMTQVKGVHILHRTSDHDHNRCVMTLAGEGERVLEAMFAGIACASQRIDLDVHEGVHPRLGATDVVPFVPLGNTSMDECIALAHRLGARVWSELGLPVYFYDYAHPQQRTLPSVRGAGYEHLKQHIHLPSYRPDIGEPHLGKAGAVIIGARRVLVAYNVFLATDDVSVAKRIAKAIRESNGGMVGVRALGLLVDGLAQVSMNLIDVENLSLFQLMARIRQLAQADGVAILRSELIGLMPESLLLQTAVDYLQLSDFSPKQVLEAQLRGLGIVNDA